MRGFLVLTAATALAQDNRGFVNKRLVTPTPPGNSQGTCAIPQLQVKPSKNLDTEMVLPMKHDSGDRRMILPTIPVRGAK